MIGRLVAWSLGNRLLVVLGALLLGAVGVRSFLTLPIDAVPDVTNVQVQVLTNAPGLSPLEIEQLVTRPVELAMAGLPGTAELRSISRAGVSAVTIVFHDDVEIEQARARVSQRLAGAREAIPPSAGRPELGPLTTGLGEVYHFTIAWPGHSAREIRTLLDWEVAYPLRLVPGVVEVNAWGGDTRQVEVRLRPSDLRALGVSALDVEEALLGGGRNAGGGALERGEEQVLVRFDGQFRTVEQIASQVVGTRAGGAPILVRDVATVTDGSAPRVAAATADGRGETVYAMVQMVAGGNAHEVVARVKTALAEIAKRLPPGAEIRPFYDRAGLVDRVLGTVQRSLVEGAAIVVVVLFLFLGDLAAGLVVATAIPLAMLGAFALMRVASLSGNLMSLGAIDFGLVVDGAVVMTEGAMASMAAQKLRAREALAREGAEFGRAIALGVLVISIVYVPVLLLEGVPGKMFRPMALTVLFALGTSLVLAFTWIPVVASLALRRTHATEPRVVAWARLALGPAQRALLARPALAAAIGLALVFAGVLAAQDRGAEFVPKLDEGDMVVQLTRPPSVSLAEAVRGTDTVERVLGRFPEVVRVVSRSGSPDVATDVMGIEQSDVFVILKPRSTWTTAESRDGLVAAFEAALARELPGTAFGFTQPIDMRVQELLGGMKSDVGIKVHGDRLETLRAIGDEIARAVAQVPGAADVRVEATAGLPLATIRPDAARMGRLGVRPDEVRAAVESVRAGRSVGTLVEGERRFDVALRLDAPPAADREALAAMPVPLEGGRAPSLGDLAEIAIAEGPAQIGREQGRRRVQVECNVRGRDLASFVRDAESRIAGIALPPGYHVTMSGQYEHLVRAAQRLAIVVPATLAVVALLLYLAFDAWRPALLILLNVPVAISGGLVALALRGLPLSISAAVGFVALFGVATLNGVVLLSAVRHRESQGAPLLDAVRHGTDERLRPVLTTAVVASLGFLPMAIATGAGAEVQRPLATVVIGGLVTATLLTLAILPSLYAWTGRRRDA